MYIGEIVELARSAIKPPFSALFLYGSCARGDQDGSSDIDILQVTPTHTKPYTNGSLNVTCYTTDQLLALAKSGSLFAKHLISEAIPIVDPTNFLETLKSVYNEPSDYSSVRNEVLGALPIIAITESTFEENPNHYSSTAAYLLRTYIYAKAFEMGAESFSMRHVADKTGDWQARQRLLDLRVQKTYSHFRGVVDLLFDLTGTAPYCREETLEAFVVNAHGSRALAEILGLRILARGELLTYPPTSSRK